MVICGPNGGHGCAGTANHRRLQLGSWLASSQRPGGGGMGSERVPACQLAATAAIAANPSRIHHSRHLQHTPISRTHAGKHALTCGWGVGMPPWEVGRWQMQMGEEENWEKPTHENPKLNVLTCGARVLVTPVLTPPACPTGQDVWL